MDERLKKLLDDGWTEDEIGVCERCGDYCPYEEMHNGLCDCCYGDMYG